MKILHIISSRGWGGAENSAVYLAKTQIERGHKAYFFIHSLNKKLKNILDANGVPYFSALDPERKNIFAIKKIINVCKKSGINLIHTHLATGCYLGVLAGNYLNIPVVSRINVYCGYQYYAAADRLLFVAGDIKNYFIEDYFLSEEFLNYKPGIGERIINGLFRFKFKGRDIGEIVRKSGIAHDTVPDNFSDCKGVPTGYENFFNIGITGRVTEQKGQQYLVEALGLLLEESLYLAGKPVMLHVVGSGKNEKNLKRMAAERKLRDNVKFWGYRGDARPFVNMFDIAVSYTTKEPFGINNIEYMLMKKPSIFTKGGGTPEIYGDTNIPVEPGNPAALKEAIKKYVDSPELMKQEAEKGRARALELFNGERIYGDTMLEYEAAIAFHKNKKELCAWQSNPWYLA